MSLPTYETDRLRLRAFTQDDVREVTKHCSDYEFAKTTLALPWPYAREDAVTWIESHSSLFAEMKALVLAIEMRDSHELVGSIALRFQPPHRGAEIGYGVYRPFWNSGYATEAAREIIRAAFEEFDLNRVESHYFACNPSSGRVMQKCGMICEGTMRQKVIRFDTTHDTIHYAILRAEYERNDRQ